jgi:hypothetical protein
MQQPMFKLDQNHKGRGLRCDSDGLFLGGDALLRRDTEGNFEARAGGELQKTLGRIYDGETDWESRIRSVKLAIVRPNQLRTSSSYIIWRTEGR